MAGKVNGVNMNIANISGYVRDIRFRGSARDKKLCADIDFDVIDEIRPERPQRIHFTDARRAKDWRKVEIGSYVEIRGQIRSREGFTSNGNVANYFDLLVTGFRTHEKDISQEIRDDEWIRKIIDDAVNQE